MQNSENFLPRLFTFFKPYKKEVIFAFIALFATAFTILLFGKIAKYFIDFGAQENTNYFFALFIILVLILAICGYLRSKLINSICFKVAVDMRKSIYSNIIKISPQFFEETKTGDIISRISNDVNLVFEILSKNFAFFLRNLILCFSSLLLLVLTSSKLTAISIILIILAILPIFIFAKKIKNLSRESQEFSANLNSAIEEDLSSIKTIQTYLAENKIIENFAKINDNSLVINLKNTKLKSTLVAISIFFAFLAIALILKIGATYVAQQKLTSGELSSFVFYAVIASVSAVSLGQIFSQIQTLKSALKRIFSLIDVKSQVQEGQNCVNKIDDEKIKISFENVNFSYNNKSVLQNFNLQINQGEKIAICGESGIGKTTIFKLLLRFYDVDFGEIKINNINIKNLSFAALRNNFSYVSQDNFIFSATILENILFANKNFSLKKIEEIIKQNEAFNFINNLPEGLNTYVGEKGAKLSGGQKQRIAILRALIKDSKILLLDEATSALDKKSEELILQLIDNFSQDKIIILISHKIPEIIKFDAIVNIENN